MNDRDALPAAPSGERPHLLKEAGASEAAEWKDRHRGYLGHAGEPRPASVEAGHVNGPLRAIEPPHQLDHLTLGAARIEARHHDGDRERRTPQHASI